MRDHGHDVVLHVLEPELQAVVNQPHGYWELRASHLQEQQTLLISELSFRLDNLGQATGLPCLGAPEFPCPSFPLIIKKPKTLPE